MLSHRKVIAFTKKRVRKVVFSYPFSVFHPSFSPRLRFLVNMILIKQWQKCPILCSPGGYFIILIIIIPIIKLLQIHGFSFNSANSQQLFRGNTLQLYWNFHSFVSLPPKRQKTILSYRALSFNASCLRYFKIISCWFATAKSTEGCNCLIISGGF